MDLSLGDKHALVTGSTAGIGLAIAQALAREGATVVINGRTQSRIDAACAQIRAATPAAVVKGVAADLGTTAGIQSLISDLPTVDILVNNVGIFEPKAFGEIDDADWFRFFETNVMSGIRLSRQYLPLMMEKNWGRIVFISSESAVQIPKEMIHYGMTKTAQVAVARGLAETTAGTGVTVNTVLPGPTRSEGVGTFVRQMAEARGIEEEAMEAEFFRTGRPTSLLKRFLTTDEIANLVVYTCSPASSGTNGAALRVDGGVIQAAF